MTVTNLAADTTITNVTTNDTNTTLTITPNGGEGKTLTVNGDAKYTVDVTNNKITGIGNGASISGTFVTSQAAKIETDEVGSFTINTLLDTDKKFTTYGGDKKVTFKTALNSDGHSLVDEIDDLDANESITGDFTHLIKINGSNDANSVYVGTDTAIGVVGGNGTVSKIYGLTDGVEVSWGGGATTLSTDGNGGTYSFSSGGKFTISSGTVDFISYSTVNNSPKIDGIKNMDSTAEIQVGNVAGLNIGNDVITFTANSDAGDFEPVKLKMNGDTISVVENLK